MNKYLWVILFVGITTFGQKGTEPTAIEVKLAKELREKFDKSDVALLKSTEKITFNLNKNKDNVEVNYNVSEKLLNINHRADIHKYEFYDSQSEINTFLIKYKNNKKAEFYPVDEFYKDNNLFYNDARVKYYQLDFPVQGYSYLYELNKKIKDVKYFTTVYFNDEFPVIDKEITITIPNWLDLEIKEFNFEGNEITKKVTKLPEGTTYKYTIKNLKETKKENNSQGPSYLYPHILFVAKSIKLNNKKTTLFNDTSDLYKWYKSLIDSIDDKPEEFKSFVNDLTKNDKTDEEKIKTIYYWVQDNIRYIAFEDGIAGFKPDNSQNVFNKRYGDCKGMANLLKQMLKTKGYDARLCWIGTKHIAYSYAIPSLSVDNHMICALFKDGKRYFLDGTEKYNSFGEYADRIQGKEVLIEDGDKFIIDKIPSQNATYNLEKITIDYSIDGETLVGHIHEELNGESKASFLYNYNNIKNDKKEDALNWYLSSGDKNYTISNIKTSNLLNRDNVLEIDYDVVLQNSVSKFDNEIYIDFDYSKNYKNLDFSERKQNFVFDYKAHDETITNFIIPAGYKVSKLPDNFSISTDDYEINLNFKVSDNKVVYTKKFHFKTGIITKDKFEEWKKTFDNYSKLYTEQIVLSK